jgi:hypothetical protein
MMPSHPNAFREPDDSKSSSSSLPGSAPSDGLPVAGLSSMTAALTETDFGWSLDLSPMRAFDALRIWSKLTNRSDAGTLLFAVELAEQPGEPSTRSRISKSTGRAQSISELADHLGIEVIDQFGDDQLVLDDLALRELIGMTMTRRMTCVLVEGPIEARDVRAIVRASQTGQNPLGVEFRAVAAMTVHDDRRITIETRTRDQALRLVAENFRHYVAAVQDQPVDAFGSPDLWQLERLLGISGMLTVRPIETDVFSTSIDVGVSTTASNESAPDEAGLPLDCRPADRSLIYDLPSHTWHDEP